MLEGRLDDLDEYSIEKTILEHKNSVMIPIYAQIKVWVKTLKTSPIDQLYEEMEAIIEELRRTVVE